MGTTDEQASSNNERGKENNPMFNSHQKVHDLRNNDNAKLMTTLAIAFLVTASHSVPSFGVTQDTPTTIDGVKAVCTGVGESKSDPRWSAYPLKLVFDNREGQYTAGENIDISQNGQTVIHTSCNAPWLLLKPAAGNYRVTATLSGPNGQRHASADFSAKGRGPQQTVTLAFPVAQTS